MLNKNAIVEVEIVDLTHEGAGENNRAPASRQAP